MNPDTPEAPKVESAETSAPAVTPEDAGTAVPERPTAMPGGAVMPSAEAARASVAAAPEAAEPAAPVVEVARAAEPARMKGEKGKLGWKAAIAGSLAGLLGAVGFKVWKGETHSTDKPGGERDDTTMVAKPGTTTTLGERPGLQHDAGGNIVMDSSESNEAAQQNYQEGVKFLSTLQNAKEGDQLQVLNSMLRVKPGVNFRISPGIDPSAPNANKSDGPTEIPLSDPVLRNEGDHYWAGVFENNHWYFVAINAQTMPKLEISDNSGNFVPLKSLDELKPRIEQIKVEKVDKGQIYAQPNHAGGPDFAVGVVERDRT